MADIIDNEEVDKDTVSSEILEQQFSKKYKLLTEKAVSLKNSYINHLAATKSLRIAVSQSDHSIEVYHLSDSGLSVICRLEGHPEELTGLVVGPEEYQVYSSGRDGLRQWDTRAGGRCVMHYHDDEPRPMECLSVSCTGRVLCGGSALLQEDAFLVFWDSRATAPLGGYWNTHSDDITQVCFHPTEPSCLASGSADGVLNIYDISQPSEDDALSFSIPVPSGIERVSWLGGGADGSIANEKTVGVVTGCQQVALCDAASGSLLRSYTRQQIAKGIRRSNSADCYVVDVFSGTEGVPEVLAGSYGGDGVVRTASLVESKSGKAVVAPRAILPSGHRTQTIRCCHQHQHHQQDMVIAGGEAGVISVWGEGGAAHGSGSGSGSGHSGAGAGAGAAHGLNGASDKLRNNRFQPY